MGYIERALSGTEGTRRRLRPGGAVFVPALAQILAAALLLAGIEVLLLADGRISSIWQIYLFPAYGLLYVFTGLFAWARRPSNGMGALIVAGGFALLAAGDDPSYDAARHRYELTNDGTITVVSRAVYLHFEVLGERIFLGGAAVFLLMPLPITLNRWLRCG